MHNGSSGQMSSPADGGKEIRAKHNTDANNTAGDSIHEPVLNAPQVPVGPLRISQAPKSSSPQQPQSLPQAHPLKMPWPRSALPKGPPPVRLGQSLSQSRQGNPPTKPR